MVTASTACHFADHSADAAECPMARSLELIANKWAPPILYHLHRTNGPLRFGALQRLISGITHQELTKRLRDLEHAGVVSRPVHATVPPCVISQLTEFGLTLAAPLGALTHWALTHGQRLLANRALAQQRV